MVAVGQGLIGNGLSESEAITPQMTQKCSLFKSVQGLP